MHLTETPREWFISHFSSATLVAARAAVSHAVFAEVPVDVVLFAGLVKAVRARDTNAPLLETVETRNAFVHELVFVDCVLGEVGGAEIKKPAHAAPPARNVLSRDLLKVPFLRRCCGADPAKERWSVLRETPRYTV